MKTNETFTATYRHTSNFKKIIQKKKNNNKTQEIIGLDQKSVYQNDQFL